MNNYDIYSMSLEEAFSAINKIADIDDSGCDGTCNEEMPFVKCDICEARHFLNEFGEESKFFLRSVQELVKYRHSKP